MIPRESAASETEEGCLSFEKKYFGMLNLAKMRELQTNIDQTFTCRLRLMSLNAYLVPNAGCLSQYHPRPPNSTNHTALSNPHPTHTHCKHFVKQHAMPFAPIITLVSVLSLTNDSPPTNSLPNSSQQQASQPTPPSLKSPPPLFRPPPPPSQ